MTAPIVHTDLGVAWITRGADGIHIEPEEIPAVVAALLVEHDRLLDAADDVMSGRVAETAHVHDVSCAFGNPTCPAFGQVRCKACRGRGKRIHGWAVCPAPCRDCGGTGVVTPPAQTGSPS